MGELGTFRNSEPAVSPPDRPLLPFSLCDGRLAGGEAAPALDGPVAPTEPRPHIEPLRGRKLYVALRDLVRHCTSTLPSYFTSLASFGRARAPLDSFH